MIRFLPLIIFISAGFLGCDNINLGKDSGEKPIIDRIYADRVTMLVTDTATLYVEARDLNDETLDYIWTAVDGGNFVSPNGSNSIRWKPTMLPGFYTIRCKVVNESNESASKELDIQVSNVSNPIVSIISPTAGEYIPASRGNVGIHAKVTNVNQLLVDSMKCYIDQSFIGKVTNNGDYSFTWDVTGLNGPKTIKVQAWTHVLTGSTTTDSTSVNVSIEGTVSKERR